MSTTHRSPFELLRFSHFYNHYISSSSVLHHFWVNSNNRRWFTSLSFSALIWLGASFWAVSEARTPQIAQAYTDRLQLYIDRQLNETYEALLRRAKDTAMATARKSFEANGQVSKVVVIVTVENNGSVAPILTLDVSRHQWENKTKPQLWITDLTASRTLLGFETSQPVSETVDVPSSNPLPQNALPTEPPGSPL